MSDKGFEERVCEARTLMQQIKEGCWGGVSTVELHAMMAQLEFQLGELEAEQALQEAV